MDLYLQMPDTSEAEWWLRKVQDDTQMEELTVQLQEKENEILAQQQAEHKAKFVPKLTEIYQMMGSGKLQWTVKFLSYRTRGYGSTRQCTFGRRSFF